MFNGVRDVFAFWCVLLDGESVTWELQLFEVDPGQHWVLHYHRCLNLMAIIEGQEVTQTLFRLNFWCQRGWKTRLLIFAREWGISDFASSLSSTRLSRGAHAWYEVVRPENLAQLQSDGRGLDPRLSHLRCGVRAGSRRLPLPRSKGERADHHFFLLSLD